MVCTLISHVILDAPAAAAAFYVALGGTQQPDSSHVPRINAGSSHLRLESQQATSSQEPREWAGHIELWTTEPLETLHNRLSALDDSISPPPQSLVLHGDESPDPRVLCTCPWGNKFIIRLAPAAHEVRGEPPGGCGTLVAISRVVRKVGPGMAEGIHAFWVGILGSLSELRATSDRSISFVIAHMASGQQIIWEERPEAELDELQPETTPSQADGRDGGTALEVLERTGITIYLQVIHTHHLNPNPNPNPNPDRNGPHHERADNPSPNPGPNCNPNPTQSTCRVAKPSARRLWPPLLRACSYHRPHGMTPRAAPSIACCPHWRHAAARSSTPALSCAR